MITRLLLAAFILAACTPSACEKPALLETEGSTLLPTAAPSSTPEILLQGTGPDQAKEGQAVYLRTCAGCTGPEAKGYTNDLAAPALDASEHASEHPDPQIHDWIVNGKLGFDRQMPALGDQLTEADVHAVVKITGMGITLLVLEFKHPISILAHSGPSLVLPYV